MGFLIGLERQITGHSIGVRTGVLVCIGASLFTSFAFCVPDGDSSRMAAQVISGVGFLGSGIIFKDGLQVRGINTAATIWCTAGIGVLAGSGNHLFATVAALCLITVNMILHFVSRKMTRWQFADDSGGIFKLSLICSLEKEGEIRKKTAALLSGKNSYLLSLDSKKLEGNHILIETRFAYEGSDYTEYNENVVDKLLKIESVCNTKWTII